jgi:hypothetical protein
MNIYDAIRSFKITVAGGFAVATLLFWIIGIIDLILWIASKTIKIFR